MNEIITVAEGHQMGALWQTEMKKGGICFTGHLILNGMKVRIGVFPNSEKKGKMPDFNIVISKASPKA